MTVRRLDVVRETFRPVYTVWELTLACDQRCVHCGSRADDERPGELTTAQALDVARQLAEAGAREVALIGGEAYLHPGFLDIVHALANAGVRVTMTTGGRSLDAPLAREMKAAGIAAVSVSVDGLQKAHDTMRASLGSFVAATEALRALAAAGIETFANTNLNRFNQGDLEAVYEHIRDVGVRAWQVQLTTPLGRAADRPEMVLQPYDLPALLPRIAALKTRGLTEGVLLMPGNNLGYFGPEEPLLRSLDAEGEDHFRGCQAGKFVLGVESDGGVKGCPSLQSKPYVGGNLKDQSLQTIWDEAPVLGMNRQRGIESLWGFCATCAFAEVCLGGCTFTAHAILGRPGNNPYCHFRARTMAARGRRERLVLIQAAEGRPFDNGLFEIVEEAIDAPEPAAVPGPLERLLQIRRPAVPLLPASSPSRRSCGKEPIHDHLAPFRRRCLGTNHRGR